MAELSLYNAPVVGGDVLAYCSKCQGEFSHVVISMISKRPAKVVCKMCKGQHNFKRASETRAKSVTKSSTAAPRKTVVLAADYWEQQMAKKKGKPMKAYSPKQVFLKDDVIDHSTFGLGIVEEVKLAGKIVVLFRTGEKILVHSMT